MVEPTPLPGLQEKFERLSENLRRGGGNGRGPTDGDVANRISIVEKSIAKMDAKLDRLIEKVDDLRMDVTRMDERLKTTASAAELAEIKGRVNGLPTTWQMITLVIGIVGTILGGAFLLLKAGLPHQP